MEEEIASFIFSDYIMRARIFRRQQFDYSICLIDELN